MQDTIYAEFISKSYQPLVKKTPLTVYFQEKREILHSRMTKIPKQQTVHSQSNTNTLQKCSNIHRLRTDGDSPRAVGVKNDNQKGKSSGPCRLCEGFGLGWSCSHPCLVRQSAMPGEKSEHGYRRARYNTYCLLDDPDSLLV